MVFLLVIYKILLHELYSFDFARLCKISEYFKLGLGLICMWCNCLRLNFLNQDNFIFAFFSLYLLTGVTKRRKDALGKERIR